ncbi:YcaO-like family protein [Streptomyces polygonati]|uniref:YcaO-like family protein n=1 Tax=Streptomyces polygonati TaxID=1617087 RepID=A0ABV8HHZ9_9ACTN
MTTPRHAPVPVPAARTTRTARTPRAPQAGERELDLSSAWARGHNAVAEAQLTPRLTDLGDAWRCHLHRGDGTGARGAGGSGRGTFQVALVGALYEALEHHHSHAAGLSSAELVLRRPHELAAGELADDPAVALLRHGPDTPMACRRHTAVSGPGALDVPLFLTCPSYLDIQAAELRERAGDGFEYTSVSRYSTNSGCAIGATHTEALVHALAEVVERDAFSLLLATTFLTATPPPLRQVDPATLPADLARLHSHAEQRLARPVHLIDMTTDLGVPAYCAHVTSAGGRPAQGQGASLSSEYAAHSALSELLQLCALRAADHRIPPDYRTLRHRPRLLAAGQADFDPHLRTATTIPFTGTDAPLTPQEHAERLTARLGARGYTPYARTLRRASNGVSTVSVFVPGLERFFAVTQGAAVIPGPRALSRARAHSHEGQG